MEPEDLDTPPFTAQERLIYVPVDILNIMVGALLDSGCSDKLHLADNRRPTLPYHVPLENGYWNANGQRR